MEKNHSQMSETFIIGAFLALSGGFQDAYTYFTRGEVFSNAQTGNVVLMSQHFMLKEWRIGINYLYPLLAFIAGVLVADYVKEKCQYTKKLHWRQWILLIEIIILFLVGFLPGKYDKLATILVSFSCAMQVQTFRKVGGYAYASTMCIGNIRSGTEAIAKFLRKKDNDYLIRCLYYFGIIFLFAIGAGIGGNMSMHYGYKAIWASSVLLLCSFGLMFISFDQNVSSISEK